MNTSDVNVPNYVQIATSDSCSQLGNAISKENCWLDRCRLKLDKDLVKGNYISWAGYHASVMDSMGATSPLPCLSGLLPLFSEKAATVSMIKHGMEVQKKVTEFLNPGQIPVIACDHPIYAIAKLVQWK
jgi:hypothetical protein